MKEEIKELPPCEVEVDYSGLRNVIGDYRNCVERDAGHETIDGELNYLANRESKWLTQKKTEPLRCPKCDGKTITSKDMTAEEIDDIIKENAEAFGYDKKTGEVKWPEKKKSFMYNPKENIHAAEVKAYNQAIDDCIKTYEESRK